MIHLTLIQDWSPYKPLTNIFLQLPTPITFLSPPLILFSLSTFAPYCSSNLTGTLPASPRYLHDYLPHSFSLTTLLKIQLPPHLLIITT